MSIALLLNPDRKPPLACESLSGAKPELQAIVNNFRSSKLAPGSMSFVDRLFGASATASRRHFTSNISITDWLDQPRVSKDYKTSLHVDPAQELPDTTKQDDYIREVVPKLGVIQMKDLSDQDTTKDRFSYEFASDEYDMDRNVVNVYSDPANRSQSEVLCLSDHGRSCQSIGESIRSTGKERFRKNVDYIDSYAPESRVKA